MYEVHILTGSQLVDSSGTRTGNESAGIISRHRSLDRAKSRALSEYHGSDPRTYRRVELRDPAGAVVDIHAD